MTCMDTQNRITITSNIREVCNINFEQEVRIYLYEKNNCSYLLLSNSKDLKYPCFGILHFDHRYRFFLSKELRRYLGIQPKEKFLIYSLCGNLLLKRL